MTAPQAKGSLLAIVFTTILIDFGGFSVLFPVLPLYAETLGASAAEVGLMMTLYAASMLLFAPLWGFVSDRIGRRPVLLISLAGNALSFVLLALSQTIEAIYIARALSGMFAATIGTAQAIVTDTTVGSERARGMGIVGAAFGAGMSLGPLLGGTLSHFDPRLPFLGVAFLAAGNFALAWFRLPETRPAELPIPALRALPRLLVPVPLRALASGVPGTVRRFFLLFFLTFGAFSLLESMVTLFLSRRLGADAFDAGVFFAVIGVCLAVTQGGLIRPLVPRFGELALLIVGLLILASGIGSLPLTSSFRQALVVGVAIALGYGLMFPCLTAAFSAACRAENAGERLGESQSMATAGRMTGPVLGGLSMEWLGLGAPFVISAALLSVAALLVHRWKRELSS
jgi:multidrug resistance protein